MSLTPEEIQTQRAYNSLAPNRNSTRGDPSTWLREHEFFSRLILKGRVLDLGCGGGRDALLLRPRSLYVGLDLSQPMLTQARMLAPTAQFVRADMYALPFSDDSFQGCWAAASLLHIPKRRIRQVLAEIRRVTSGICFIAVKEGDGEVMLAEKNDPTLARFYAFWRPKELAGVLSDSGFGVMQFGLREIEGTSYLTVFTVSA